MNRNIIFNKETATKIESGSAAVCNAVKCTLGPKGNNAILSVDGNIFVTNDGATIAKSIFLKDQTENAAAQLIKQASLKTNEVAGDGTTTACILTNSILKLGLKEIEKGESAVLIRKGIEKAKQFVLKKLNSKKRDVCTNKQILQVATISGASEEVGNLVLKAFNQVGKDGIVTAQQFEGRTSGVDFVEGMQFDSGFVSAYFCNDGQNQFCEYENCKVLLLDFNVASINVLLPVLEKIVQSGEKLVVIAPDFSAETIAAVVMNKLRGVFDVCLIKTPVFALNKSQSIEDIAAVCNGEVFLKEQKEFLKTIDINNLGFANKITISKESTTIIAPNSNKKEQAIERLNKQKQETSNDFEKNILDQRISKICGKVAIIKVGGISEVEVVEQKLRVDDAICAAKGAIKFGILPGGGTAFAKIAVMLKKFIHTLGEKERVGANIVLQSLKEPILQIASNAGLNGKEILEKVESNKSFNFGFDAKTETFGNMFIKGVIDAAVVATSAFETACSVASSLLSCSVCVCDE